MDGHTRGLMDRPFYLSLLASDQEAFDRARTLNDFGVLCMSQAKFELAYDCFLEAIEIRPEKQNYLMHLAQATYMLTQKYEFFNKRAVKMSNEAVLLDQSAVKPWVVYGNIAVGAYEYSEAIAAYEKILTLNPSQITLASIYSALGHINQKIGNSPKAKEYLEKALEYDPDDGQTHYLLSTYYTDKRRDVAKLAYHGEKGVTSDHSHESLWNSANGYLSIGEYEKGWKYFEERHKFVGELEGSSFAARRFGKGSMWNLEPDKIVHVHAEQGQGDSLQFVRYLPMVKALSKHVRFESRPEMTALLQYSFPDIEMMDYRFDSLVPEFDYHIPLMSLPYLFQTRVETIPAPIPYIRPQLDKIKQWKAKLTTYKPLIGICWAGERRYHDGRCNQKDQQRSMSFEQIKPLLECSNLQFVSLQLGKSMHDERLLELDGIKDWSDTAAIMHHLDAVISVDTAVLHLAGAMGKKTWLLDKYDACWRWLEGRDDSPWYPTMKIIRQKGFGIWDDVIERMRSELT